MKHSLFKSPLALLGAAILLMSACSTSSTETAESSSSPSATDGQDAGEAGNASAAAGDREASKESKPARPEPGPGPMPKTFSGIHDLLMAASLDKEPNNMAFNKHNEPIITLRWFARYGTEQKVRVLALRGLGLYPTPANVELLGGIAMNESEASEVRSGALIGLGRYDLEQDKHSKIKTFVFETVSNDDLTLAAAATDAMHGMPTARPILLELIDNPQTAPQLKAAAERALGPQVQ